MVADRVATRRKGTDQVLVVDSPRPPQTAGPSYCEWRSTAGSSSVIMKSSSKTLDWNHYEDEAGAAFIITPPSVSRPMGSWWPNGAVFFPLPAPVDWSYPSPKCFEIPFAIRPCARILPGIDSPAQSATAVDCNTPR